MGIVSWERGRDTVFVSHCHMLHLLDSRCRKVYFISDLSFFFQFVIIFMRSFVLEEFVETVFDGTFLSFIVLIVKKSNE